MTLSLKYGALEDAFSNAQKISNELDQYANELCDKVQAKIRSVAGGSSAALSNADYYVSAKIRRINEKSSNASALSVKLDTLLQTAKRVDSHVKATIEASRNSFFVSHPDLKPKKKSTLDNIREFGWNVITGIPILGDGIKYVCNAWDNLVSDIKYWYHCQGGKEFVGMVLSVAEVALSVVVLVSAVVFTGGTALAVIAGVAGIISAAIGVADGLMNYQMSVKAYNYAKDGDPSMALYYSKIDTVSDYYRKHNFHNKKANQNSFKVASAIEITDTVCGLIAIVNSGAEIRTALKDQGGIKAVFKATFKPDKNTSGFKKVTSSIKNAFGSLKITSGKEFAKDILLGDFNIEKLSVFSKLKSTEKIAVIGKLAKASKGVVSSFDKINQGDMTFVEFGVDRLLKGGEKALLKRKYVMYSPKYFTNLPQPLRTLK